MQKCGWRQLTRKTRLRLFGLRESAAEAVGRASLTGRYYSCPFDGGHLFWALLYVERNPVRAGLVRSAAEYEWSRARARLGYSGLPDYLSKYRWAAAYSAADWALLLDQGVGVEEAK